LLTRKFDSKHKILCFKRFDNGFLASLSVCIAIFYKKDQKLRSNTFEKAFLNKIFCYLRCEIVLNVKIFMILHIKHA